MFQKLDSLDALARTENAFGTRSVPNTFSQLIKIHSGGFLRRAILRR